MRYLTFLSIFFLGYFTCGFSEIQKVEVTWDPLLCQKSCVDGLRHRFSLIQGVQSIEINQTSGMATLKWKPTVQFSFVPINYALRWIGIREIQVRVEVRGKVAQKGSDFYLNSIKDGTPFLLMNRLAQEANEVVVEYNPQNRPLSADLIQQLESLMKHSQPVTISGTLFMPERSPPAPLSLIINSLRKEDSTESKKKLSS